ncbi:hypothetical protein GALMADRAFT_215438 [Galerina marginata CBS 339.88]|uniref:Beta/gamma crystallin 'Greek key' domain-containing protein n=1 Tax=Galerina marginata (strain CBS 339.88) TaxID=685588 RepID=A0A067SD65_GALM3|nr:hypothetical protein GALMADRAFT_215438 [Galerina marginata CBS 339.88]
MYFTAKLFIALLTVTAASASVYTARTERAELSAVFFSNVNLTGGSFSPNNLVQDRAESILIGPGYTCTFFVYEGCEGNGTTLSGEVDSLPAISLSNNIESFICDKQIH